MSHDVHHVSRAMYYKIYFLLMLLLVATVGAAYIHIGIFNFPLAMLIASVKTVLVVLFFMHVRFSEKTTWIFSAAGFIWLAYLLVGIMIDYLSRFAD